MPLSEEHSAALTTLAAADPKDVADELKAVANPAWTLVFNAGHQKATKHNASAITTAEKARDDAHEKVRELEGKLTEAAKGNPDVEKIRRDAADEIARVTAEAKQAEDAFKATITEKDRTRALDKLEALMTGSDVGIKRAWAKIMRQDPDLVKRLHLGKDGELEVWQAGREIPLAPEAETDEAKLRALAVEIRDRLKTEDPDAIVVAVDEGGGVTGGSSAVGDAGGYDPVKDGKARAERQKGLSGTSKLAFT